MLSPENPVRVFFVKRPKIRLVAFGKALVFEHCFKVRCGVSSAASAVIPVFAHFNIGRGYISVFAAEFYFVPELPAAVFFASQYSGCRPLVDASKHSAGSSGGGSDVKRSFFDCYHLFLCFLCRSRRAAFFDI